MSTSVRHILLIGASEHRLDPLPGWRSVTCTDIDFSQPAPAAVLFDGLLEEEQFGAAVEQHWPKTLRILCSDGLQSLAAARAHLLQRRLVTGLDSNDFRALFATPGPELYRMMANTALAQREIAAMLRCDLNLLASDAEINLLINGFGVPEHILHWSPLTLAAATAVPRPFAQRSGFVSLGDLNQPAHWDTLMWSRRSLWPMIRRRLPEAQLHIYSHALPEKAHALHDPAEGFHVLAQREDALHLLGNARVCLAPLRMGCGIKRGLLQAMQAGTPSVTTPIGSEAMHGALPWPGAVAALAESLADAAAQLHEDETRWYLAQQQAAQILAQRYDRGAHAEALAVRIEQTLADLPQHRLYNFAGAMLRQQRRSK